MEQATSRSGWGQLKLFVASLWLTLATAVFCAVVPAGLPHTAPLGSAFNPSTSAVALHPSDRLRVQLERADRKEPVAKSAGAGVAIAAAAPMVIAWIGARASVVGGAPATLSFIRILAARFPRGPPIA
ncbi:hypothetical protein [Sphingomonas sp. M1-B02]|uniref:hypothetical protein n=1 Tax=Sphingomonas sp. M1-B02 TaxID=3114300 RepID=UPI002240C8A6|nr:hypothetical protein [Sphingomonas sp. S6-11]UZK67175.1 hypothetical protein OKW87_04915 [Sphingomonas sp. S6-11]